jgi:transposase-like protein
MTSREVLRGLLVREIEAIKESDDLNPETDEDLYLERDANLSAALTPRSDDLNPMCDVDLEPEFDDLDQEERAGVLRERLRVLQEAVDGLDSLDWGEIPDIFAPTKGKRGKHPAAAKRLTAKAAQYVGVVREMGLSPKKALALVAKEFGEEPGTIRQWIKELRKSKDIRLQDEMTTWRQMYKVKIKRVPLPHPNNMSFLHSEIKKAGIEFRKARAPKRAGKNGT